MIKIAVVSFTKQGTVLKDEITKILEKNEFEYLAFSANRSPCEAESISMLKDVKIWVSEYWRKVEAFIFIGGSDIAVRMFMENVSDKLKDPCCIVVDEDGKYVIPILGNHLGRGNELATEISKYINASSIITTPIDVQTKFSLEKFARRNQMETGSIEQARIISAAVLDGQHIGFYSEYPVEGIIPEELRYCKTMKDLSWYTQRMAIRSQYVIGMGVKENANIRSVEELFLMQLEAAEIELGQIKKIATIDKKAEEPALVNLAEKYRIPLVSFTAEQLLNVNMINHSEPEEKSVANISERAAFLGSECGEITQLKVNGKGATLAIAKVLKTIYF